MHHPLLLPPLLLTGGGMRHQLLLLLLTGDGRRHQLLLLKQAARRHPALLLWLPLTQAARRHYQLLLLVLLIQAEMTLRCWQPWRLLRGQGRHLVGGLAQLHSRKQ
jgi:hypothetical protein